MSTGSVRTGLVMEGGALRGLFTAGVTDVWMENGIEFDGAVGVSAGTCFGVNVKSRQIGRAIRYNKRFCRDWRYGSFRSLILTGNYFNTKYDYEIIPRQLDPFDEKTFRENPLVFYTVVTDVETGGPVYHKLEKGDRVDMTWIRASASIPAMSKVVEIDGGRYLDGGTADSIPLEFMEREGYSRNVVITTQPLGFVKKPNELMPILRVVLRKYPKLVEALADRHIRYNAQLKYIALAEATGRALVVRPPEALNIKTQEKDPQELERVYQIGRAEGLRRLEEVRAFLNEPVHTFGA